MADITVELPDGNIAEFPEGTPQETIENALLGYAQEAAGTPPDVPTIPPTGGKFADTKRPSALQEFVRDIPAVIGGIAAPYVATKVPAVAALPSMAQRAVQVGAAGLGGAVGEAGQVAGEVAFGAEGAPQTGVEAAKRIGWSGAEQAAFEGVGQLAVKVAQRVGKAVPSISELNKQLVTSFRGYGGELTPASVTDSWWVKQLDALSRGSLTGSGAFKTREVANEEAFKRMEKDLVDKIASSTAGLSDQELGNLFVNSVRGGRAAHSAAASRMYGELDQITPGLSVDVSGVKQVAADTLQKLQKIAGVGSGEVDTQLLRQAASLPKEMTFSDAHMLRSSLLGMQRDLTGVAGAGRAQKIIGDMVSSINASMDKTAVSAGGDVFKLYTKTNKFWRQGKETFDNRFIVSLLNANKKNPERIGEAIFREGNVTEVLQAKKAIKAAAKLDKTFNSEDVWRQMQAGYLQSTLSRFSNAEGVVDSARLAKAFVSPKSRRTLQAAFSKDQRDKILEFALVGERLQKAPEGGLGMVMNLAQAGTIVAAAQAPFTGYQVFEPGSAIAILLGPRVMAKMLTSPKTIDTMIAATKTPANSLEGGKIAAKLVAEYRKIAAEMEEPVEEMYYGEDMVQIPLSRY